MPGTPRYHAPPVSYPVGRCFWEGGVLLGLCLLLLGTLLTAATVGADPREHPAAARFLVLGLLGWCLAAALAFRHWRRSPQGQLRWARGQWTWSADGANDAHLLSAIELAWDGQTLLLLRLHAPSAVPRWVWLERQRDVARWDDLRRAVWACQRESNAGT